MVHFDDSISETKNDFSSFENIKMSSIGKTLYSNIVESLEEYGESLSNEEKINILKKIIHEILN